MNSHWTKKRLSMYWSQVAHWSGAFALNAALCNCIRKKFVENERIPQGCKCSLFHFVSVPCNSGTQKRHLVQYNMMYFNPLTPRISFSNSPYCHTTLKMLVQRIWHWINLFHLITCLLDVVLIWYNEKFCLRHSHVWVKGLILLKALVFRGRNIVGASSLNMVVMIDIDGNHFWRFSP